MKQKSLCFIFGKLSFVAKRICAKRYIFENITDKVMKHLFTTVFLCSLALFNYAQTPLDTSINNSDSTPVFTLGEVIVKTSLTSNSSSSVTASKIELFNKNTATQALNILPGVNVSAVGSRNESMVYVSFENNGLDSIPSDLGRETITGQTNVFSIHF
jgi:hypothetical protein